MSTIADYSVFTKAFLASKDVDFSKPYGTMKLPDGNGGHTNEFRAFAVVPLDLSTTLTTRGALNLDHTNWTYGDIRERISCHDADGNFIGNIVRVQPGVREGSIRLVAKVAVPVASAEDVVDTSFNTFVLLRTDSSANVDLPIAVATISDGYTLHKHLRTSKKDSLDDVENAYYVSFTINHLNGYTSVDFNPDAYATYDDVANALSRGIDGLHIAFDTASGDLKLLDKDGNVLDQANLPIKTDVIIADGEEGYKYVKTDKKQDIHAAKAWMPEGKTAWKEVKVAPYTMKHAALVVGKGSSRVFVSEQGPAGPVSCPISIEPVRFEHVKIGDSIYMVAGKTENDPKCSLFKVKGGAGSPQYYDATISGGKVTIPNEGATEHQPYDIKTDPVDVDVVTIDNTRYVLGEYGNSEYRAIPTDSGVTRHVFGKIVTFEGSSRVLVPGKDPGGPFPVSTAPVQFDHIVTPTTTYMVTDKSEDGCHLFKVKGDDEPKSDLYADISNGQVKLNNQNYDISNNDVEVDVTKEGGTTYVIVEHSPDKFQARSVDGEVLALGRIVTFGGSSTGGVVGITLDKKSMYTFEDGATTPSEFKNSSGQDVTWLCTKTIPEGYTFKYGLEAFVWTVKDAKDEIKDPFFHQLNASLLALGFHEGDDIALGTNLSTLAPTGGVSPLNKVDANKYIHGKDNKATREGEVNTQRANAKEELAAWNAQHPALTEDRSNGTIIDFSGLDVRNGSITLGCGSIGEAGVYGIQMEKISGSLDFTISHTTGNVQFDENGHAANLTSSTLLSIEPSSYISGAPTCLILAEVTHNSSPNPVDGPTLLMPVRMTAGFSVAPSYSASDGLSLTIHDDRENISSVFVDPNNTPLQQAPAIIEVQAIYTHQDARLETVPAQQMHTYIGSWDYNQTHPVCSFLCNKIEEWMTAIGLADTNPDENVKLYVVIRVY